MKFEFVNVTDPGSLLCVLCPTNPRSLPSGISRTKGAVEDFVTATLLTSLSARAMIKYPLSLQRRDRPDLLVHSGGKSIGIEITEACSEQYRELLDLREREYSDGMIELSYTRPNAPKLSVKERRALLGRKELRGQPFYGDEMEQDWVEWIAQSLRRKSVKLENPEFDKFDENWLAVWSTTSTVGLNLERAIAMLPPRLAQSWKSTPKFDRVFVIVDSILLELKEAEVESWPLATLSSNEGLHRSTASFAFD